MRKYLFISIVTVLLVGSGCFSDQTSSRNYTFYKEFNLPVQSDSYNFYVQQSNYEMQKDFRLPDFEQKYDSTLKSEINIKIKIEAILTNSDSEPVYEIYSNDGKTTIYIGSLARKDLRLKKYYPEEFSNHYIVRSITYFNNPEYNVGGGFTISY